MFYEYLFPLSDTYSIFNVFQYITFRAIYATVTALVLSFLVGPYFIRKLKTMQVSEVIRGDGPESHQEKEGTPTMGGVLIIFTVSLSVILWGNFSSVYTWTLLFVLIGMGAIGFIDDYGKLSRSKGSEMGAKLKMFLQVVVGTVAVIYIYSDGFDTNVWFPFFKNLTINLGILYVPFAVLVIVGASNAVNLTDGLDGLAIGPMVIASGTYMLFAYITGHAALSDYLNVAYIPGVGELAIFAGAMVGASLGFLWFNTYPASVFMGDIGSLSLGGALGTIAVMTKHEIVLILVGGIFVVEALSVIFQVGSYKLRGKRVFAMAPIHHHFELKGWAEPKIIVRFWIIAIILSLIAISTLKLR